MNIQRKEEQLMVLLSGRQDIMKYDTVAQWFGMLWLHEHFDGTGALSKKKSCVIKTSF